MRIDIAVQILIDGTPLDSAVYSGVPRDIGEADVIAMDVYQYLHKELVTLYGSDVTCISLCPTTASTC